MTDHDPFGRAIHDHHRGERNEPLVDRDGEERRDHPIEAFYFGEFDPESEADAWRASWLDGPLLDIGAGAGRDTLYFQERFETVAIEVSEHLVREAFDRDRFRSALVFGTQIGLTGSMQGLREFLGDLAHVTTPDGTALLHGYDPDREATEAVLGYRADPTPGLAFRVYHTEYAGEYETLLFRLFSPDRLREATVGTGWELADLQYGSERTYTAALRKV
ncbi:SAM-dependent methyltransferase [Halobacteriales archaeon SW_12_67_38]|nr:MAG: SAM-dependent methyltransferase [Halobacteriales archaeon SW_12_67_38]